MSERTSIIKHKEANRLVIIRQDYVDICDGDHCMAALLGYYEYKLNAIVSTLEDKVSQNPKFKPSADDYFIQSSPKYLSKSMLGLFGRTKIISANDKLLVKNLITIKIERKDEKTFLPTKVCLNVSQINLAIDTLSKNEQPLVQKQITPYSEMDNPLFNSEQPPYSKTDRDSSINSNLRKLSKKEKYLFDFDFEIITIINERPKLEKSIFDWIDFKYDVLKEEYKTIQWLKGVLEYSDYQIIESIKYSIIKEYKGFFPKSVKEEKQDKPQVTYKAPVKTAEQLEYQRLKQEALNG